MSSTTDLDTLKINYLTQAQYNAAKQAGTIEANELYLTPAATEEDPVFTASAAYGISSTDISNWNAKVSDDHKWNDVALTKSSQITTSDIYLPYLSATNSTSANLVIATADTTGTNAAKKIPKYNNSGYLVSTTPTSGDSSTKVATTEFVAGAIPTVPTKVSDLTNDAGYITSYTDEYVKSETATAGTEYLMVGSTSASTNTSILKKHASLKMYSSADSETNGYAESRLGNTTKTSSSGGKEGQIRLYGTNATYYTTLKAGAVASSNKTITFPNTTGTVALTSDIPTVPSNIVNTISTTAGSHTAITSQTGSVSFNVPTKTSHLTNDSGYLTSYTETDPTVPSWAKASSKPSYSASEVGAVPVMAGIVQMYAGSTAPSGWLMCDGSAVSRTTYSALFAVIGTTYGTGDGSTTFNLPDFRNNFPVGAGSTYSLNSKGGSADAIVPYHRHSVAQVSISSSGAHAHMVSGRSVYNGTSNYIALCSNANRTTTYNAMDDGGSHTHTVPSHNTGYEGTDGNTTNANLPPYIGINFIIATGA